jgi:hypothetical protein
MQQLQSAGFASLMMVSRLFGIFAVELWPLRKTRGPKSDIVLKHYLNGIE